MNNLIQSSVNEHNKDLPSIFIAQPTLGAVRPEHVMNIVGWFLLGKYRMAYHPGIGSIPHDRARNILVADFLEDDSYDYLLFLDANTIAPFGALEALMEADKDVCSITAQTFKVSDSGTRHIVPTSFRWNDKKGGYSFYIGTGVEEVDITHMACTLIKKEVLQEMERPWFSFEFADNNGTDLIGEEFSFSRRVREAGYKIFNRYDMLSHHFVNVDTNTVNSIIVRTHNNAIKEASVAFENAKSMQNLIDPSKHHKPIGRESIDKLKWT